MRAAAVDARRDAILALVAQGKGPAEIATALGTTPRHYADALAWAGTSPQALARARRAQRTADRVHRGVPLPVAAALEGQAAITALRDLQLVARLDALRRPATPTECRRDMDAGFARWRGTAMHKNLRHLLADKHLLAVLEGNLACRG
jgi:hypothetical protein